MFAGAVDRRRDNGHALPTRAPMHDRYAVDHDFLSPAVGDEVLTIAADQRVLPLGVQLLRDADPRRRGLPDRLRQRVTRRRDHAPPLLLPVGDERTPEVVRVFCVVTGREPRLDLDTRHYFEIGDRDDLSYTEKLAGYRGLADELLRGRPLPRLLRQPAPARRRAGARLDQLRRLRPPAGRHRPHDLPGRTSTTASSVTSAASSASGSASAEPRPRSPRSSRRSTRARG